MTFDMDAALSMSGIAGEFAAASAKVDPYNWILVLLGILVPIPVSYFPHIRQAYYQWRLDRSRARDRVIYQDELRDYEYQSGGDLAEADWRKILWAGIFNGAFIALVLIIQKLDTGWGSFLSLCVLLLAIGFGFRHHYQGHETKGDDAYAPSPPEIPAEAIWGLFGGLFFVVAIVMFVIEIF